ncbi:MAG: N-glycosylase/DNA lyase [Candidatus Muiribacteriota bacterium]|jgi:N-glycosylase/DNA lyase
MSYNKTETDNILKIYNKIKPEIIKRLRELENNFLTGNDEDILAEMTFCIFTPQSKAKKCWESVCNIKSEGFLTKGTTENILNCMDGVRFKYKKSEYAYSLRNQFLKNGKLEIKKFLENFNNAFETREWLVKNIKGYGYKEASHFLRNIGFGKNLAILDRHILKNMILLNIIKEIPKSLNKKNYVELEKKLGVFSEKENIPMDHLDLLLWYKEAGEIFK